MRVGIVGAGQLARMMAEEASALGIDVVLLAESAADGAVGFVHDVRLGSPMDPEALSSLAAAVDVLTFDHELVDLGALSLLESEGHRVHPSPSALAYAVDKAKMRQLCSEHALPAPRFELFEPGALVDVEALGQRLGWPLVLKAARGGYDGRGVFVVEGPEEARRYVADLGARGIGIVAEEHAEIRRELAALVVRRPNGELRAWPAVETAQIGGVCREVLVPGSLEAEVARDATALARSVAETIGLVGVMAVELFDTPSGLVLNELALRPHNSGHWTQDGAATSQFANHLRAVLDLPLGTTDLVAPAVASVNVFGGPPGAPPLLEGLQPALAVPGARVHLYGKETRPMRKLGHVNVTGDNAGEVRRRAWAAAAALGTPVPAEIEEQM
jgi:5-(carboxyamino)imidazole ribonucleotide synthase